MRYPIIPVAKPRMTRADKWKKRKPVLKYFAFAQECKLLIQNQELDGSRITFYIPMARTWSQKRKLAMLGLPHHQKPDIDNLAKALFDALYSDDSGIAHVELKKVWAMTGSIEINKIGEPDGQAAHV